jgi:hypothetical protein
MTKWEQPMLGKGRQILFALIVATLPTAKLDAVTVTNSEYSTTISARAIGSFGPASGQTYFNYYETRTNLDHGVLMTESRAFDSIFPIGDQNSYSVRAGGSASTQTRLGNVSGQINAMTSGIGIGATALVASAPWFQLWTHVSARGNVSLKFDEPVNVRVGYIMGGYSSTGKVSNGAQQWDFQNGDAGVLNFTASTLGFTAFVGSSESVEVDGCDNPGCVAGVPRSDFRATPIETTTFYWAISPLNEEPVLPGQDDSNSIWIGTNPRIDPNGGFDPIPVGTQEMLASSDPTFVGIGTKVVSDIIQGTIFESIEVKSVENPLTSLLFNDVPPGSNLTVTVGGLTRAVVAGEPIDLGPGGVESLVIAGLDPAHSSTAPDALVFGLGFAESGVASIEIQPINSYHAADINLDGAVDAADYVVWRKHLGTDSGAMHSQGDANGDGVVDAGDFTLWRNNFGAPGGGAAVGAHLPRGAIGANGANTAVPEPTSLTLAGLAITALAAFSEITRSIWCNGRRWRTSLVRRADGAVLAWRRE